MQGQHAVRMSTESPASKQRTIFSTAKKKNRRSSRLTVSSRRITNKGSSVKRGISTTTESDADFDDDDDDKRDEDYDDNKDDDGLVYDTKNIQSDRNDGSGACGTNKDNDDENTNRTVNEGSNGTHSALSSVRKRQKRP